MTGGGGGNTYTSEMNGGAMLNRDGRSAATLALTTLLHAFTHAYQVLLVPLYLLMAADLKLPGVRAVTLVVTAYNAAYFLLSYPAGMLADRLNRKMLLGVGLLGNAVAIGLTGITHQYGAILLLGVSAGIFGTLFHPAANALLSAHYPRSPGMALGIMGIGSGIGFFFGSQYSGWRAESLSVRWLGLSNWQLPCVETALAGLVVAGVFLLLAREVEHATARRSRVPMGARVRCRMLAISGVLGWRDFAGAGAFSLLSIYLQKAQGYDARQTGWILGAMMLISVVATPLAVWATSGRRRLGGFAAVVIGGGVTLISVPHVPMTWLLTVLGIFQTFLLGSYAIGEVALVERVGDAVRGRVIGLYLTICGTMGAISPWVIGWWTDRIGRRAYEPGGYVGLFAVLGGMMIVSSAAVRLTAGLGAAHSMSMREAVPIAEAEPAV